jgi:23S rRNA pseudouridine2605 synthase
MSRKQRDEREELTQAPERLQKILARAGYGSRRTCEVLIEDGRVHVDGQRVTELGTKVDPTSQEIKVDGRPLRLEQFVYYLLNKPKGVLSSLRDPEGRRTIQELIPGEKRRIFPVGRLDIDSKGAVILTNDGRLTNLLTHPRYGIEKTYLCRIRGNVTDGNIAKLRAGVWLAEGKTLPAKVWIIKRRPGETDIGIGISEGKNRQVRRMFAAVGSKVLGLTRTRIGPVTLRGLSEGAYRPLTKNEVEELERIAKRNAGSPPPTWAKRTAGSRKRAHGKPDPANPVYSKSRWPRKESAGAPLPVEAPGELVGEPVDEPIDDEPIEESRDVPHPLRKSRPEEDLPDDLD